MFAVQTPFPPDDVKGNRALALTRLEATDTGKIDPMEPVSCIALLAAWVGRGAEIEGRAGTPTDVKYSTLSPKNKKVPRERDFLFLFSSRRALTLRVSPFARRC